MRTTRIIVATLLVGTGLWLQLVQAQGPEIERVELARHDFGDSVHEVIQVRVDFRAGAAFPRHSHPGVEVAYVLAGALEYELDDAPPVRLRAGESLFIPAGAIHSAKNVGTGSASELATYVVRKREPLVMTAP
jgi:quercetin dioxygenase-like cupin family protein